jgi:translation initiation factor 1
MASLKDLASLLNVEPGTQPTSAKPEAKRGFDGEVIRLKVFTQKRRGKNYTIVKGFKSHPMELNRLLDVCRKKLGTGGQLIDQSLEFQGDHVQRLTTLLKDEGYRFA